MLASPDSPMNRKRVAASWGRTWPASTAGSRRSHPRRGHRRSSIPSPAARTIVGIPPSEATARHVRADAGADDRRHRNVGGRGDLAVGNHPHELLGNGPVEQRHYQAHLGQQMLDQERITQSDDVATYQDGHRTDSLRQSCTHLRVRRTQEVGDHKPVRG